MHNYLEDKVIVVTGAGSGFGELVCKKAANLGAHIVAADIMEDAVNETVSDILDNGGKATAVVADAWERCIDSIYGNHPTAGGGVYAINQPWGVSISDITVRASGDDYIM